MGSAHHRRNASNSRNESNNRAVNTEGTPAKAGKFAKVAKPATACGEANYSRDTINIRDDSSSRDNIGTSWISTADCQNQIVGKSATAEKPSTFSSDTNNSCKGSQLGLLCCNSSIDNMDKGHHFAAAGMPEIIEMTTTVLASCSRDANSTVWTPTTHEFSQKFVNKSSEQRKVRYGSVNPTTIRLYRKTNVASPTVEVR